MTALTARLTGALTVLVLTSTLVAGCGESPAPASAAQPRLVDVAKVSPAVLGYALEGSATPASITRDGRLLGTIGVDGVSLTGGGGVSAVSPQAAALRRAAVAAGRRTVLLVSNYSNDLGDFDEPRAHAMLTSATNRAAAVTALVQRAAGFGGVQIDLESLLPRDTAGLLAFTTALRHALPRVKTVSMAFMASDDAAGYTARGYDLTGLARVLDTAVLMAYDLHGPWSGPGPIAAMPWVRAQLRYFLTRVPRAKVDLGAAAYGYRWGGGPAELTVPQARRLSGTHARWKRAQGEWTARLRGGRRIWWDDARSVQLRRRLAAGAGLHGVAIWQIGSSGRLKR